MSNYDRINLIIDNKINLIFVLLFIMTLLLVYILFLLINKQKDAIFEHLTATSETSNEGLQTLSSVYNSGNAVLTNLNITGELTVGTTVLNATNGSISGSSNVTAETINTTNKLNVGNVTINSSDGSIILPNGISINTFSDGHWEFGTQSNKLYYAPNGLLRQYTGDYSNLPHTM